MQSQAPGVQDLLLRAIILVCVAITIVISASHNVAAQPTPDTLHYKVVLTNGDAFRCAIMAYDDSTITMRTEFDTIRVRKDRISQFVYLDGPYRKRAFHYLMPTASPSGPGGFLSNYELAMFYGGFGLGYGATISGGISLVPGLALDKQLYHVGAKFTLLRESTVEVAVGGAFTWIGLDNMYSHMYAVTTYPVGNGRVSMMLFYRVTGKDAAPLDLAFFGSLDTTHLIVHYESSIGAAFGFDAPAFGRDDIMWIGEIWNNNLERPQNTVSMVGIRVFNERLSADFGVALFTAPFIVPVTRFEWRF